MKQHEAVIEAMQQIGGYATLGQLYQTVLKIPDCKWGTKTPFASIRRIVQTYSQFFKIKPGLWGLTAERERVIKKLDLSPDSNPAKVQEFNHSFYQGLVVEIGNLKGYQTFIPNQDKNKPFLSGKLADIASLKNYHEFTYDNLLRRARTVDVTWFNERKLPRALFEVEHNTDFYNSLLKFLEFQDFRVHFSIIADAVRRREFNYKLNNPAFKPLRQYGVKFIDYETLSDWHTRISASIVAQELD